jgi:hypothetical protein
MRLRRCVWSLLLLAMMAGCGAATASLGPGRTPLPERTPFPLPSGATEVALPTQAPATPLPSGVTWACPAPIVPAVTIGWDPATKTISFGGAVLRWPRGFSARAIGGHVEIVTPDGLVVGHDGSVLIDLGGVDGDLCWVDGHVYGPSS